MNVQLERLNTNTVKLTITEAAESFAKAIDEAYRKNVKRFNIPGFRKGKVPRQIIEQQYGKGVFYEDAFNALLNKGYYDAIVENNLEPVARPDIDVVQMDKGQDLIYTITVTVAPDAELGQYKGVEVEKGKVEVTEDMIDAELIKLQERNARLITVEDRGSESGDTVNIDFEGFVNEEAFEGGKGEGYDLVLGSNTFIPGFEDQLVGKKAGEEADVVVTFPTDYQAEELAGKEAVFKCKVNEIKVKELPAIDDELAKDVSEFDNLEQLKADLRMKLEKQQEESVNGEYEDNVLKAVVESSTVEVPEVLVDNQIDQMVRDFEFRLRYQGLDLKRYLELTNATVDSFRGQFKEEAEYNVRAKLVLKTIAKVEDVQIEQEDIDKELEKMAAMYQMDVEQLKEAVKGPELDNIRETVLLGKALDLVVAESVAK